MLSVCARWRDVVMLVTAAVRRCDALRLGEALDIEAEEVDRAWVWGVAGPPGVGVRSWSCVRVDGEVEGVEGNANVVNASIALLFCGGVACKWCYFRGPNVMDVWRTFYTNTKKPGRQRVAQSNLLTTKPLPRNLTRIQRESECISCSSW